MPYTLSELPQPTSAQPGFGVESTLPSRSIDPREVVRRKISRPTPQAAQTTEETSDQDRSTGQPTINEEAPKDKGSAEEESVTLSPQLAALARKEAKYRQQIADLDKQKAQLEAERKELEELKALKQKLEAKDYSDLSKFVSYEDYANFLIEQQSAADPEKQAIKKLESELEALKQAQQNDVEKRFEQVVAQQRASVKELVASNPEFSTIKELKQEEAVVQHILDTWEHDSVELSPEQAAKEVEEALLEKAREWTSLSKLKSKEEVNKRESATTPSQSLAQKVKTLTNSMQAAGEIKRTSKPLHQITSDVERWKEARLRVQERKKQAGSK